MTERDQGLSRRRFLQGAAASVAGGAVVGIRGPRPVLGAEAPGAPRVSATVKIGHLRNLQSGPVFLGVERKYFEEVGVKVERVLFQSGAEMVASLGTGELALGAGALNPGLYNAWGRNVRTLVVADSGQMRPGYGSAWVVVRAAVASQIRDWPDLRGRSVNFSVTGSVIDYLIRTALRRNNMTLDDVNVVRVASPDMLAALRGGRLDAGGAAEAFATLIADTGLGVKWKSGAEIAPRYQYAALMMSERAAADRSLAVALLHAYLRGTRDFMNGQQGDPAVLEILQKYAGVDQAVIRRATPSFIDVNGEVQMEDIRHQQEFWVREKVMLKPVDPAPFVNAEFAAEAVRILGRAVNPPARRS